MPVLVMKFGGTSVANLDRIRRAAKRVGVEVAKGYDVIVIVSAMSGKTNELVGWVNETSPMFDAREYDAVVSSGENITAGLMAVISFFMFFIVTMGIVAWALALTGLDFVTAISGAATAVANVGPGLGDIIGPAGNFSSLNDAAKWILSSAMLIGRLELMAVFAILTIRFWRA